MKLAEVPAHPAYLVFHDAYMNGAMDVYPVTSLAMAQEHAALANMELDATGQDECGIWRAYEKLPRKKVWKYHGGQS
jgi:hypothetical protein